jgi:hypothetical protein
MFGEAEAETYTTPEECGSLMKALVDIADWDEKLSNGFHFLMKVSYLNTACKLSRPKNRISCEPTEEKVADIALESETYCGDADRPIIVS